MSRSQWRDGAWSDGERSLADEVPVSLTYGGASHAVMMATPADLEDFAIGFSITEGIIDAPADVASMEMIPMPAGIDARLWLRPAAEDRLALRRRRLAGAVGCGMCGLERLQDALRPLPVVDSGFTATPEMVLAAIAALPAHQALNGLTRSVHAAGFWTPSEGLVLVREDVGRHNALDKLVGAARCAGMNIGSGITLLTSRLSVELVQKAAIARVPILVAVSAPTVLALQTAREAGITIVAVARADGFEVFSHPHRIGGAA
jgi:FdhD protein